MWQTLSCGAGQPSDLPRLSYVTGPEQGPLVLLLHGVCRAGADWEPMATTLAADGQVLLLDQRGHGRSDRADSYKVTDYVEDAVRFVRDHLGRPVTVIGHSLGAMVAAGVAAEVPDLVKAIVLEDPPFHTMGERIFGTAWEALFRGMQQAKYEAGPTEDFEGLLARLAAIEIPVAGETRRLGDLRDLQSLKWSATCLQDLDPEVLTPIIAGQWLDAYDFPKIFSRVKCPTLILQADPASGGALSDRDVDSVLALLQLGTHAKFPHTSHQIHRERPEEMLSAYRQFCATWSN